MNVAGTPSATNRKSLFIEQMADEGVLREAWYRVQRGGKAGGVDGMTVGTFRAQADRRLAELRKSLISDAYRASPVKRVQIPKPSGGWRVLGLPTIADRIAQSAAASVLHDRVAALFSDRSFAYRPFLGPRRAAIFLRTCLASAAWVVTADIEKFFDNVEHRILSDQLRNVGVDDAGVRLILKWLLAPAQDHGRQYQPVKGLPQGSPVAPILANLYLTGFDTALEAEAFTHVRYADDFVMLAPQETEARRALGYITTYLGSRLRLQVKPVKTQLARAEEGFNFVGFRFTQATWTVPSESITRFQEAVTSLLDSHDPRNLPKVAKAHNDLVRGWRHYYFGNSIEMDRQLSELDAWRAQACAGHLDRCGQDPDGAVVWFERLVEQTEEVSPDGTYSHHEEATSRLSEISSEPADPWHQAGHQEASREGRVFSTAQEAHDAAIGRKQLPVIFDDGWLRVPTFGAFVTQSQALVIVRRKKQVIFECPFDDVAYLTIEADGVALSTTLIDECARRRIPVAFCRLSGKPVARIVSARSPLDPSLVHKQFAARSGRRGTQLVLAILTAKLSNQRALLLYHSKYRRRDTRIRTRLIAAAAAIADYIPQLERFSNVPMRKARQHLFLIEAKAAAHYWEAFASLVPENLQFHRRAHREAGDVVNKALNYGYAVLLNRVWLAVHRSGLDASLGLLHTGRRRSAGLVFDLMEPFRQPAVDRTVLGLLGRGAQLRLNEKGDLTLRTRGLLQRAIARRLEQAGEGRADSLSTQIQRRTLSFRRALTGSGPYHAYRMTW